MASSARTRALTALTALTSMLAPGALGCEPDSARDDDGGPAADAGTFPMELGKGELTFAPLQDGEALPYEHGPQGGQHVWVAFRMRDLDPLRVLVQVTTTVEGHDELLLERRGRVNFEPDAGSSEVHVYAGWPAQILYAVDHPGERATIDVVLEDRAARRAHASATIEIAEPD